MELRKNVIAIGGWGELEKLEIYPTLKKKTIQGNFYFQIINRFSLKTKFNFRNLHVSLRGTWIPEAAKPMSQHTAKQGC